VGYPETGSDYDLIDDLTYQYTGNRLQKVDDSNNPACQNNGFSDNGSFTNNEYLYDLNGNMIQDLNKEISNIDYTFSNLPQRVEFTTVEEDDIIYFWYDAGGQKLRKQTRTDGAIVATMDYIGSFVYENGFLQYILTDEGRIVYDRFNNTYQYQYFLNDHLGNMRILFDENGTVLQDNSYYPFGMSIDALCHSENFTPDNNYLFNGKELQDDFGLDWYDYGARFYDPDIARWNTADPLSEKYVYASPYCYTLNNPIKFSDINGQDVVLLIANEGAGGNGHMGAIIQDGNGEWHYMTIGNADPNATQSQMVSSGSQGGMALIPLGTKDKEEAIALAKQDDNNSPYKDHVEFNTSTKMDKAIFAEAQELQENINSGEIKYNAVTNNCAHAVEGIIEEGTGVDLKSGSNPQPNKRFENIKKNKDNTQKKIDSKVKVDKSEIVTVPSTLDNIPAKIIVVPKIVVY
jgi:RHS repeat-associated protein